MSPLKESTKAFAILMYAILRWKGLKVGNAAVMHRFCRHISGQWSVVSEVTMHMEEG